jgi:hypothetical protein
LQGRLPVSFILLVHLQRLEIQRLQFDSPSEYGLKVSGELALAAECSDGDQI